MLEMKRGGQERVRSGVWIRVCTSTVWCGMQPCATQKKDRGELRTAARPRQMPVLVLVLYVDDGVAGRGLVIGVFGQAR